MSGQQIGNISSILQSALNEGKTSPGFDTSQLQNQGFLLNPDLLRTYTPED